MSADAKQKLAMMQHTESVLEREVASMHQQIEQRQTGGSPQEVGPQMPLPSIPLRWSIAEGEYSAASFVMVSVLLAVFGFRKVFRFLCRPLKAAPKTLQPTDTDLEVPMKKVIDEAAFVLPKQAMLLNFVHHNPWENLQHMNFHESFHYMEELLKYMSPGERLFKLTSGDSRIRSNQALSELSGAFLDRGNSKWKPPNRDKGFLYFFASLEGLGSADWREHARQMANRILEDLESNPSEAQTLAEFILKENLIAFGASSEQWTNTLRAMLFELPGYAGMFQRMDNFPAEAPHGAVVRLTEFAAVQSILARSSIEYLAAQAGWDPTTPLGTFLNQAPTVRDHETEMWQNPSGLAFQNQNLAARESLETEYEQTTLNAIGKQVVTYQEERVRPLLQVYTCIDEREESFRRHLEEATAATTGNPNECETFGVAGFFNFPVRWIGALADSRENEILAPEGSKPDCMIVETRTNNNLRRSMARLELLWEKLTFNPVFSLIIAAMSPITMVGLAFTCFFPITKRVIMEFFWGKVVGHPKPDFEVPFTTKEAAMRLWQVLGNMGLTKNDRFAPIVVILGHGSRTVNNPFDAAHNCGACGGREGGPNARLIARCANDPEIRQILAQEYNIHIPDDTHFVGGYHDTSSELVELSDEDAVPASHEQQFAKAKEILYKAQGRNALERCSKFMLANGVSTESQALTHVATRCTDLGEARPELGHATNASVVVGRRELTKGLFLARRAFLPTYDPFNDDDRGTNLERVITPALVVCSGISLEYLFSTTDGGAGTKVCMNLVGHFGVQQGTAGDLLVGLPTQMTEMHSPLRAMYLVDAPVSRVQAVLSRNETIRNIVHNDWVRLFVRDPITKQFYRQQGGRYYPVDYNIPGTPRSTKCWVPFTKHGNYVVSVRRHESLFFWCSVMIMLLSCGMSTYVFGPQAMHARGPLIAVGGTILALCALTFSRRYLQGEFMFDRMALLSAGLLAGFNLVATAPNLATTAVGWNTIGFCSAFLIGSYNDRPTVRQNTTYVFAIYRVSDAALLLAGAFNYSLVSFGTADTSTQEALIAAGLLIAALLKTSQFPLTNLFARSMEGTSPGSALGDASLAAHIGIVLLSGTMPLWFGFTWARVALASVGLLTAITSSLISQVRADRKGSLGYATQATIGLLYVLLAMGYVDTTLILAFGHAAARMVQFLRSPNFLLEHHQLTGILEAETEPKAVSSFWYRLSWRLNRWNSDTHLPQVLHLLNQVGQDQVKLGKFSQWFATTILMILAGAPFTPIQMQDDQLLSRMLKSNPSAAVALIGFSVCLSTALMWFVMTNVLNSSRFLHRGVVPPTHCKKVDPPLEKEASGLTAPLLKADSLKASLELQRKKAARSPGVVPQELRSDEIVGA